MHDVGKDVGSCIFAQQLVFEHAWEVTRFFHDGFLMSVFPADCVGCFFGVPSHETQRLWAQQIDQCEGFLAVFRNYHSESVVRSNQSFCHCRFFGWKFSKFMVFGGED